MSNEQNVEIIPAENNKITGIQAYVFCNWYFCKNCCLDCYMCTCRDPFCYCCQFEEWNIESPSNNHRYCDCFYNTPGKLRKLLLLLLFVGVSSIISLILSPILVPLLVIAFVVLFICFVIEN